MVTAREGVIVAKAQLADRFQEAIDEAAMRLGATGSDAYLDGWSRSPWQGAEGKPTEIAERVAADLEAAFTDVRLKEILDGVV